MKLSAAKSAHKFTSLVFIILVCLLGGSITGNILAWSNIATLIDSREMTYIPQFFETPFTLSRSHADANYLEQTAQSLIFLRYNVSPESVKANHKALLRFFDNGQRPQMQELLAEEAKQIIENNVTSAFYLSGMDVYVTVTTPAKADALCEGNFVNPITDICWDCLFPMTIGNVPVFPGVAPDTENPSRPIQICPMGILYRIGLAIGYWEPFALTDVTRSPYCMVNLGGFNINVGKMGAGKGTQDDPATQGAFYHGHCI